MRSRTTTEANIKWIISKVMFRALSLLWLLMVMFIFQNGGGIQYSFHLNSSSEQQQHVEPISNSSSEQRQCDPTSTASSEQQQYDLKSSSEQQQLPSPLRTRSSQPNIQLVGLAEFTLRVGQQEKQLRRLLEPTYHDHDILWRRRMLKGYGTPSSPSDMNHLVSHASKS